MVLMCLPSPHPTSHSPPVTSFAKVSVDLSVEKEELGPYFFSNCGTNLCSYVKLLTLLWDCSCFGDGKESLWVMEGKQDLFSRKEGIWFWSLGVAVTCVLCSNNPVSTQCAIMSPESRWD